MKARITGDEEYGYNPRLRKLIIEVVENQMRDNNPPITDITFNRLLSEGYTKQQAKEKIAVIVTNHIYDTMKYKIPFNEERFPLKRKPDYSSFSAMLQLLTASCEHLQLNRQRCT